MNSAPEFCPFCTAPLPPTSCGKMVCEYCGATFVVESQQSGEPFDVAAYFERLGNMNQGKTSYIYLGPQVVKARVSRRRLKALRQATGAPQDQAPYALCDSTFMSTGKKGFIMCESGVYLFDENEKAAHISWEDFAALRIRQDDSALYLGEYKFLCLLSEVSSATPYLAKLAGQINSAGAAR